MVGIYKITNPSGAIYIGQSWNIDKRFNHYRILKCKEQPRIYNSLKKYGWENHQKEIVIELPFDITQKVLDNYEIFVWQQFKEAGYEMMNLREPTSRGKLSKESIDKIKEKRIGFKHKAESIEKMRGPRPNVGEKLRGQKRTEEFSKNISNKNKGHKYRLGTKVSRETRDKMSKAQKGKKLSKEHVSNIIKGKIKPFLQINPQNMETIYEFLNMSIASKELGFSITSLCRVAKKYPKLYKGYYFKYK